MDRDAIFAQSLGIKEWGGKGDLHSRTRQLAHALRHRTI